MAFRTVIDGIGAVTESSPGVFTTTGIIAEDITSLANDTLGGPGVVGGMQVSATSPASNQVSISAGKAWVENNAWAIGSEEQKFFPVNNDSSALLTIPANSSGNARIDLVCVKIDPSASPGDDGAPNCSYVVVQGTPAGSPTPPSVPALHTVLAQIAVANGFSTITTGNITDRRSFINPNGGWEIAGDVWAYQSVDDPTGVIQIIGVDRTAKYSAGMRLKFRQGSSWINGIMTRVEMSGSDTHITFLHEIDPTDSQALTLMTNTPILSPYFSSAKVPYGFPLEEDKWTVYIVQSDSVSQSSPTNGVYYNITSLSVPIGSWIARYETMFQIAGANDVRGVVTIGTSSSTELSSAYRSRVRDQNDPAYVGSFMVKEFLITNTSKTTYYLNMVSRNGNASSIAANGADGRAAYLQFRCAYL